MEIPEKTQKVQGKVKWFSPEKGFGFIITGEGAEFFAHHKDIISGGFKTLQKGQDVEFEVSEGERGPHAISIKLI